MKLEKKEKKDALINQYFNKLPKEKQTQEQKDIISENVKKLITKQDTQKFKNKKN